MLTRKIVPGQSLPDLVVSTIDRGSWNLREQAPQHFTLIVIYRGLHCPICKTYLRDLDSKISEFSKRGVEVLALSTNSQELARNTVREWDLKNLTIGYGLAIDTARELDLYISNSISEKEPAQFTEPGLFLVNPNATLYAASIQSMPFARPAIDDVLQAIDTILAKEYPARGAA